MTGPEHYREAERLIGMFVEENDRLARARVSVAEGQAKNSGLALIITAAQVHATLALAAASAQNIRRNGAVEIEADEWEAVLS